MKKAWLFLDHFPGCAFYRQPFKRLPKKERIQEKLGERIEDYRKRIEENCQNRIWETASGIVDSMLIEEAKQQNDTIQKPPKPGRPDQPEYIPPKDSTPVERLFEDSLRFQKED